MPVSLRQAVLAAEDREFYDHGGFDPTALIRAGWNDINGGDTQGGSTITQQYAKNAYLSHEQTIVRKARELVLIGQARDGIVEGRDPRRLPQHHLLRSRCHGVETASQSYFGKPANKLTLSESRHSPRSSVRQAATTGQELRQAQGALPVRPRRHGRKGWIASAGKVREVPQVPEAEDCEELPRQTPTDTCSNPSSARW